MVLFSFFLRSSFFILAFGAQMPPTRLFGTQIPLQRTQIHAQKALARSLRGLRRTLGAQIPSTTLQQGVDPYSGSPGSPNPRTDRHWPGAFGGREIPWSPNPPAESVALEFGDFLEPKFLYNDPKSTRRRRSPGASGEPLDLNSSLQVTLESKSSR